MNIDLTELFRLGGFNPLAFSDLSDTEELSYLKGANLARPIKLEASNGLKADVFNDSSYGELSAKNGIIDGQLNDPVSGRIIKFADAESFNRAQEELQKLREQKLEEELEKKLHDKVVAAQMLMISSAGGPEQTESQYKNAIQSLKGFANLVGRVAGIDVNGLIGDQKLGEPIQNKYQGLLNAVDSLVASFDDQKKAAVVDAVRSNISFMSLAELIQFASRFPGLDSVIKSRLALIKKAGLDTNSAQMKSGHELSDLASEHKRKTIIDNFRERKNESVALDFGVVKLDKNSVNDREFRNKADWYPTIDIA